jgi:haloalkane dehalogenase
MIKALRTPDDHFTHLPGYPFEPNYITQRNGLRMHYVNEGSRDPDAPCFLCLHGQPSWSYLYRKMIPVFAGHGRVVAPDLFGFGRSDKPMEDDVYTFEFHRDALIAFIETLDLQNIVLVCQDWGGLLGLTIPHQMSARFRRLIVMNTAFPTGEQSLGAGFEAWKAFNRSQPDLDIAMLFKRGTPILSDAEAAAYGAPFPDINYKAGVRRFPELVPVSVDSPGAHHGRAARDWFRDHWQGDSFMAIGASDPVITLAAMRGLRANIRGCPEPMVIEEAGHFVQEWGESVARAALRQFGFER